jgi:hypothetical protein
MVAEWQHEVSLVRSAMTDADRALAMALYTTERFRSATAVTANEVPPMYDMLAFYLNEPSNRTVILGMLT